MGIYHCLSVNSATVNTVLVQYRNTEIQSRNTAQAKTVSSGKPWLWLSGLVDRPHNGGIVLITIRYNTNTHTHKYKMKIYTHCDTNTHKHKYSGLVDRPHNGGIVLITIRCNTNTQIHTHCNTNTQICKYTNTKLHKYSDKEDGRHMCITSDL